LYLVLVFLPLIGCLLSLLFGRTIGGNGSAIITTMLLFLTFLLSLVAFYEVILCGSPCYFSILPWMDSGMFTPQWGFFFDSLTCIMLVVITCISSLVHLYSINYMSEDPHLSRFMSYLSLFTFFMIILVTGDNFVQLFVGWEGVGLCSYLLINFWHTRIQANKAAIKAMLVNRVGDVGLALGIFVFFYFFQSVDFSTLFALAPLFKDVTFNFLGIDFNIITLGTFFLFIGAVGKSAQLGLHTWLPDAMEGPTPVSALIHAATMVTAGVFLISRCSPLFEYSATTLMVVTIVGSLTAIFGASTALVQNDIKRVIAYSTCSQLGYMILICGLSHYSIGVFHLFNHAFFKALLFLGAGSVIHAMGDEQDLRRMGGLRKLLPFSYTIMVIGSFSLMGFPFLTGFYSKDAILEIAFSKYSVLGHFAYTLGCLTAFFTSFYSIRLIYLVFINKTNAYKQIIKGAHEGSILMYLPLFLLTIGSIFFGFFFKDLFIGLGTNMWGNALFILPSHVNFIEGEFLPTYIKLLPNIFVFGGALLSYFSYRYFQSTLLDFKLRNKVIFTFLSKKWFFDRIYNSIIVQPFLIFAFHTTYKGIDKGFLELIGPRGLSRNVYNFSLFLSTLHSGFISHYAFIMFIVIFSLIFIMFININLKLVLVLLFVLLLLN